MTRQSEKAISEDALERVLSRVKKPGRYIGGEWNAVVKDWGRTDTKVALAYPDIYEVGMSNLGLTILYDILNRQDEILAERTYAPWIDMEEAMREAQIPLYSLETRHPLSAFDVIGFTLPYELNYTNVLNMLELAGIPPLASERGVSFPLVIGGGNCAYDPEPLADFFDLFVIGEGEEVLLELVKAYATWKREGGGDKLGFLRRAGEIEGIYVPSLYWVDYNEDGTIKVIIPKDTRAKPLITKRIVFPLPPAPTSPPVPYIEVIHDRGMIEIQRGCTRGCRFCQAGIVYRPFRERPLEEIIDSVDDMVKATGYAEIALVSLSSTDYSRIEELLRELLARYERERISFSLPSLRVDSFSRELAELIQRQRKIGLTFAPEAASRSLRNIINKPIREEEILETMEKAYRSGWRRIKLYFMVGLPKETLEDVMAIADLARRIHAMGRWYHGRAAHLSVSVATFVPKPHTPFQWMGLDDEGSLRQKLSHLRRELRGHNIRLSWHNPERTLLEACLARGDRRLGKVLLRAWQAGAKFDAWEESFQGPLWWQAFAQEGLDPHFYASRQRPFDEVLPWDHINTGVSKGFLKAECLRGLRGEVSQDCRSAQCLHCGVQATFELPTACKLLAPALTASPQT